MDFHSLSRRELQALCKRNKIPANITNVAMADALADLPLVEGIDELLNGEGSKVPESPMKEEFVNSEIPRTALRTSTRRKTVKDESITTRTRRAAAARCTEESENRDLNVALTTPSLPSGRRRAAAASSACKKVDFQMNVDIVEKEDNDSDQEKNVIEKTPAPRSQKRVAASSTRRRTETRNSGATEQRVYSTRRSVRLLEKNMESLGLGEGKKIEPISVQFDEVPNSTGPVKEDMSIEVESKKIDESERQLVEDLEVKIDNQEKNELESEVKVSEAERDMDRDSLNSSVENLVTIVKNDDSETDAPDLNVKRFPVAEVEEANEVSKDDDDDDDDDVKISSEEIKLEILREDVDLIEVHSSSIGEEFSKEVEQSGSSCESECINEEDSEEVKLINISTELSLPHEHVEEEIQVEELLKQSKVEQSESKCASEEDSEGESELMNISAELSLPHEYVEDEIQVGELLENSSELSLSYEEEEAQVDDVLNSVIESVKELKDDDLESEQEESLHADIEGEEKNQLTISVQSEEEEDNTANSSMDFPENVSEEFNDVKIQLEMEEAPKHLNDNAIDSVAEIRNDIEFEDKEALVEKKALASQFPRPVVETKSAVKEQTINLLMENSDAEEDEDEEQDKANCIQSEIVEKNDKSLRQLRKMFKEKLQVSKKKKMDNNNNTKVVGGGKVRTALQPLTENRMVMDELEKRS